MSFSVKLVHSNEWLCVYHSYQYENKKTIMCVCLTNQNKISVCDICIIVLSCSIRNLSTVDRLSAWYFNWKMISHVFDSGKWKCYYRTYWSKKYKQMQKIRFSVQNLKKWWNSTHKSEKKLKAPSWEEAAGYFCWTVQHKLSFCWDWYWVDQSQLKILDQKPDVLQKLWRQR